MRDVNGNWPTGALVSFVALSFVAGCYGGQEYLRYQVRSAIAGAFGAAGAAPGATESVADANPAEWPEVDLSNWTWGQEDGRCLVNGEVKNVSGEALARPRVSATVYDKSGQVVATDWSFVDISTLAAGATAPFDIRVLNCPSSAEKAVLSLTYGSEQRPTRQKAG